MQLGAGKCSEKVLARLPQGSSGVVLISGGWDNVLLAERAAGRPAALPRTSRQPLAYWLGVRVSASRT
eukprot:5168342-Pyramimonas_sp.AAC.1